MRQSRPLTAISRPLTAMQAVPTPVPLEAETYRPRGSLAAVLLLVPALLALGVILLVLVLRASHTAEETILAVGAGLLAVWLLAVAVLGRILLITVQASIEGIEVHTIRDERILLRWKLIDDVSRRLGLLRLRSSDGKQVTILESGLTNGQQLLRQVLLRVSPTVLSPTLQEELKVLGGTMLDPVATQTLAIAPHWWMIGGILALGGVGLAVSGVLLTNMLWFILLGVVLLALGILVLFFCRQRLLINSQEITLITPMGATRTLLWSEISLIESLPLGLMMRLLGGGDVRMTFWGPFFLTPLRAEYLRAEFNAQEAYRGIMTYRRWRLS